MYGYMYVCNSFKIINNLKMFLKKNNCHLIYEICEPTSYKDINPTDKALDFINETALTFGNLKWTKPESAYWNTHQNTM